MRQRPALSPCGSANGLLNYCHPYDADMLTQVLLGLCAHAEVIQPLREKIVTVIQEEGWKKPALYKLKLMDSVLKESQRMKPVNISENF